MGWLRMTEPPKLAPLNAEQEQLNSESCLDGRTLHAITKSEAKHPVEKTHFSHLCSWFHSFGEAHRWEWGSVSGELCFRAQLPLHHNTPVPVNSRGSRVMMVIIWQLCTPLHPNIQIDTSGLRSGDTTAKSIINLRLKGLWYQVHSWASLCSDIVFVVDRHHDEDRSPAITHCLNSDRAH